MDVTASDMLALNSPYVRFIAGTPHCDFDAAEMSVHFCFILIYSLFSEWMLSTWNTFHVHFTFDPTGIGSSVK